MAVLPIKSILTVVIRIDNIHDLISIDFYGSRKEHKFENFTHFLKEKVNIRPFPNRDIEFLTHMVNLNLEIIS